MTNTKSETSGAAPPSLVVRGHAGYLIVPILLIPSIAFGMAVYFRGQQSPLPAANAEKIVATACALALILAIVALFLRSRWIELSGGQLHYHSWFTDRRFGTDLVTAISFESDLSGSGDQTLIENHIALWSGNDPLVRLNLQRWPRDGLRALLSAIKRSNPSIRIDRAVENHLGA